MKKTITLALALMITLSMTACSGNKETTENDIPESEKSSSLSELPPLPADSDLPELPPLVAQENSSSNLEIPLT